MTDKWQFDALKVMLAFRTHLHIGDAEWTQADADALEQYCDALMQATCQMDAGQRKGKANGAGVARIFRGRPADSESNRVLGLLASAGWGARAEGGKAMNMEDFFIAEYEKLKDENESLKAQVTELSKPDGAAGLLHARVVSTEVEAVKVTSAGSYTLREYIFDGKPSSYIEGKKADVDNAAKWPSRGYEKALSVSRETFTMLIEVKTIGKVRSYLVDGDCKLDELGDMEQGKWCLAEQEAELVENAKNKLLGAMDDAIKRLKEKEAKEAAND